MSDCAGPSTLTSGTIDTCISISAGEDSYGGAYQLDDNAPGGQGCRVPNPAAGGVCGCPAGFVDFSTRALVSTSLGSHVNFCLNATAAAGGIYQYYDSTGCYQANIYTNACSCPPGYEATSMRVIVDGPSGSTLVVCSGQPGPQLPPAGVEICPGQYAILDGAHDCSVVLQTCINAVPPYGTLSLPPGWYGMLTGVTIYHPIVLQTTGIAPGDSRICGVQLPYSTSGCATLHAMSGCCQTGGLLVIASSAAGTVLNHIMVDGNRGGRVNSVQYNQCIQNVNNRGNGVNARFSASNITMQYSASINALCASGLEWTGDQCNIQHNFFASNGDHYTTNMWSDGLTLLQCRYGVLLDNYFQDNSDVNLILGCGTGSYVNGVSIMMQQAACYAGLMLDCFDGSTCGDYTNFGATNITIDCGAQRCDFGANFGPLPWYAAPNIVGGTVDGMSVIGGKQGVNVGGAGTAASPFGIANVTVGGEAIGQAQFNCGLHQTSAFNIDPASVASVVNVPAPTNFPWRDCP